MDTQKTQKRLDRLDDRIARIDALMGRDTTSAERKASLAEEREERVLEQQLLNRKLARLNG